MSLHDIAERCGALVDGLDQSLLHSIDLGYSPLSPGVDLSLSLLHSISPLLSGL